MPIYNRIYRHGVDAKRRVQIPAKWRPSEPGYEFTLVLWPSEEVGPFLRVLPPEQMAKLMRDIDALPNDDPNKVILKRFIGSNSAQVSLDRAGRICIPEEMARDAKIENEATLVGSLDRFEIWNPERFEKVKNLNEASAPKAFQMMG